MKLIIALNIRLLNSFGIIAPVWLIIGVIISSFLYPGYSHLHQALSELHATGSPAANITPLINHYPLSLLFFGFGVAVYHHFLSSLAKLSAIIIMLHGTATFFAGYFVCDIGCNPESQLPSQGIHQAAGLALFLSLLIAPALWAYLSYKELHNKWFAWLSIGCVILQLVLTALMLEALETGLYFGLYQRAAYGVALVWLFLLALILQARTSAMNS